jgi:hypothetical protein
MGQLLSHLAIENIRFFPTACVDLLSRLTRAFELEPTADWVAALREIGAAIVGALPDLKPHKPDQTDRDWWRRQKAKPVEGSMVVDLLETLAALEAIAPRQAACESIAANPKVFDPATLIVPALQLLHERNGDAVLRDKEFLRLWGHSAGFLLTRSEQPPESPKDWRQDVKIVCPCRLDMTHVTERTGSPQTLVCSKTRARYERRCRQYSEDLASMAVLRPLIGKADGDVQTLRARMDAARQRRVGA